MKTSQLFAIKWNHSNNNKEQQLLKAISIFLAIVLLVLTCYQFKYRDLVMLKLGMSRFFNPVFVGILSYFQIGASFFSSFLLVCWSSRRAAIPAMLVFACYAVYNTTLFISTGSTCGCANVFVDIDLRYQIAAAVVLLMLSMYYLVRRTAPSTVNK